MTHETTAPVQSLVDEMVQCACGDEYPAGSYGAGFIHGSGMCENCDAALPAKDIAQQAAPVAVPDGWRIVPARPTDEMIKNAHRQGHACPTSWYIAMLSAAPNPPAFERVSILKDVPVRYGSNTAEPTPPAQQSQWVPVSTRLPTFPAKGKCHVLALEKGNPFPFPVRWTGKRWEYLDGDTARNVTHWMPLPAAPGDTEAPEQPLEQDERKAFDAAYGHICNRPISIREIAWRMWKASAARRAPTPPAQQSQSDEIEDLRGSIRTFMDLFAHGAPIKGQVDVMARLVGWDGFQNVERSGDTAAPEQAEQPDTARDLISRLVAGLEWALPELNMEPFGWASGESADAHQAAIDAVAEARALLEGGGV